MRFGKRCWQHPPPPPTRIAACARGFRSAPKHVWNTMNSFQFDTVFNVSNSFYKVFCASWIAACARGFRSARICVLNTMISVKFTVPESKYAIFTKVSAHRQSLRVREGLEARENTCKIQWIRSIPIRFSTNHAVFTGFSALPESLRVREGLEARINTW